MAHWTGTHPHELPSIDNEENYGDYCPFHLSSEEVLLKDKDYQVHVGIFYTLEGSPEILVQDRRGYLLSLDRIIGWLAIPE